MQHRQSVRVLFLILSVFLVASGCGREIEVEGDVFVVTSGAGAYKLALTEVRVFEPNEVDTYLASQDSILSGLRDSANRQLARTDEALGGLLDQHLEADMLRIESMFNSSLKYRTERLVRTAEEAIQDVVDEMSKAREVYHVRQAKILMEHENAPEPIAQAKTDTDGQFTLRLREGQEYVFFATASRRVDGEAEHYAWLLRATASDEKSERVVLSNDNLAGIDSSVVNWSEYPLHENLANEMIAGIVLNKP